MITVDAVRLGQEAAEALKKLRAQMKDDGEDLGDAQNISLWEAECRARNLVHESVRKKRVVTGVATADPIRYD